MSRLLVTGGTGFFGQAAIELLRELGMQPLACSRRASADVQLDVEDRASLDAVLRPGDVLLDTVGPFQDRTTRLLEAALRSGCDLVDIADSLAYARRVDALRNQIAAAGVRVLTSCSSVSALTALLIQTSGIVHPTRVASFLAPATRYSASPSTALSLLRSVGQSVEVLRDGATVRCTGWLDQRVLALPPPIGRLNGHLFETADVLWLPQVWPSLQTVEFYVDTHVPGLNAIFLQAARRPWIRRLVERFHAVGHRLSRGLGKRSSCLAMEIEGHDGALVRHGWHAADRGYRLAVVPAALAAKSLIENRFPHRGLVPPHQQIDQAEFDRCLTELGIELVRGE